MCPCGDTACEWHSPLLSAAAGGTAAALAGTCSANCYRSVRPWMFCRDHICTQISCSSNVPNALSRRSRLSFLLQQECRSTLSCYCFIKYIYSSHYGENVTVCHDCLCLSSRFLWQYLGSRNTVLFSFLLNSLGSYINQNNYLFCTHLPFHSSLI